jgi:hypothetical protein
MITVALSNLHFRDDGTSRRTVYGTLYHTTHGSRRTQTEIMTEGTLDYCISFAERGHLVIKNSQDVLQWLYRNVDFKDNRG